MQNKEIKDFFKKLADERRLSHGYIFFGEAGKEKKDFALALANYLEVGVFDQPQTTLSDVMVVSPGANGSIGIEESRILKNFLFLRPENGHSRVLIIDQADLLTPQAEHAILKITEEPPEHALIIFIINNTESLLPTVLSRFQKIYFQGEEGRMELFSERPDLKKIKDSALKFLAASRADRSKIIKDIIEKEKVEEFVDLIIVELHRRLLLETKEEAKKKTAGRGEITRTCQILQNMLEFKKLNGQYNINKRLQLEAISAQI